MAEKADKKADAAAAAAAAPAAAAAGGAAAGGGGAHGGAKKGGAGGIAGLLAKTPVMLGGVMILEAVVLFAGFKFLGAGPKPAGADVLTTEDGGGEVKKDEHGNPIPGSGGGHAK